MKTIACVNLNNKEVFESSVKFGVYSGFKDIINEIYSKKGFDHVIEDSDIEEHINLKKTPIYKDWETNKSKIISNLKFFTQKRDFRDDIDRARNYYDFAKTIFGEENVSMITSSLNVQTVIIAQPNIKKEILIKISEDEYNFLKESFPGTNDAKLYFVAEQIKEHNVKPMASSNFYVKKQKFAFHNGQRPKNGKIWDLDFDGSIKSILDVFINEHEFYNIINGTFDYNISNYKQFTENVISSLKDGRLFKDDNQILMAKEFVYAFIRNEIQIGEDISSINSELLELFLFNLYSESGDVISQEESRKKREEDINIFLDKYKLLVDTVHNLSGKGSSVAKFFEDNAYNARSIEYFDFKMLIDYINKDSFENSERRIKYLKEFEEIDKGMPNSTKMAALDILIQYIKNAVFENKRILFDNGINPEEDYSFEDIYERFCEKTGLTEFFYNKIKNLTKQLNIRVKFETEFSSSQYYGHFYATTTWDKDAGKVGISSIAFENKQRFSETLIHETLHALSIKIISAVNSGKTDGLTPLQIKGVKNIIKIYNEIKKDPNIPRKYVVSDILEFVAALTEKDFYDYLKSKDKSIIGKIKEFFANLLNIDINQDPYIYKQTIKNLDRLIGNGSYLIKNGIVTDRAAYNTLFDNPELVYKKKDGSKIFQEKETQKKEIESSFQSNDIIWKKVDSFGKTIKEKQTQNQQPNIIQEQENITASNIESTLSNSNQIKQGVVELFESNPTLANAVYEALGFGKERSVLESISLSDEGYHSLLSKLLLEKNELFNNRNVTLDSKLVKQITKNDNSLGVTWMDNIYVSNNDVKLFLHEYIHKFTSEVFINYKSGVKLKDYEQRFISEIQRLYDKSHKIVTNNTRVGVDGKYYYGLTNIEEFVSEGITDNEFIKYLSTIKDDSNKTFFDNLINTIKGFINKVFNNQNTVSESVFNSFFDYYINKEKTLALKGEEIRKIKREQYLKQRGEKETEYKQTISYLTPQQKQQAQQLYSQYLESLNNPNTNPILQGNQQEQVKKFTELQERLNNKEFLEGAKNAYESSEGLQEWGTQEEYNDYIARVSLGIIKNPSSGEYNYTSKVKDIVYHGTDTRFENFDKTKIGSKESTAHAKGFYFGWAGSHGAANVYAGNFGRGKKVMLSNLVKVQNSFRIYGSFSPIKNNPEFVDFLIRNGFDITKWQHYPNGDIFDYTTKIGTAKITEAFKKEGYDSVIVDKGGWKTIKRNKELGDVESNPNELIIFEPEQIHILGSKQDIEGFRGFVAPKQDVQELFESNPTLANEVYEALGLNIINESEITYTDEEGNPCAKMGLTNTVKGTDWKIVKDFKGKPKHSNGGVDITISDKGVSMRRGGKDIKAQYGLLIPAQNLSINNPDKPPFDEWYKTVPKEKNDTTNYNLRRAYELAPKEQLDEFVKNPDAHLYSVYKNPKTGEYEFMKSKNHPTLKYEIDWYNSEEGKEFRNNYDLDMTNEYYKYIPKIKK